MPIGHFSSRHFMSLHRGWFVCSVSRLCTRLSVGQDYWLYRSVHSGTIMHNPSSTCLKIQHFPKMIYLFKFYLLFFVLVLNDDSKQTIILIWVSQEIFLKKCNHCLLDNGLIIDWSETIFYNDRAKAKGGKSSLTYNKLNINFFLYTNRSTKRHVRRFYLRNTRVFILQHTLTYYRIYCVSR